MEKIITVCTVCGSNNVQIMGWYNPNTEEFEAIDSGDVYENWCGGCGEHTELTLKTIVE